MTSVPAVSDVAVLEHVDLIVESDAHAAAQLTPSIAEAVRRGEAVHVLLDAGRRSALHDQLPTDVRARVSYVDADDRYGTPARAMKMLVDLVQRERAADTPRIHVIGEIAFAGDGTDREWIRYESAANEVFANVPLRAVCLYDPRRIPTATFDAARAAHPEVHGDPSHHGHVYAPRNAWTSLPGAQLEPDRAADLTVHRVHEPRAVRHAVSEALGARGYDIELRAHVELIVAELVTNAVVHARATPDLFLWCQPDQIVVSVRDDGPGVDAPFLGFQPPGTQGRGAGLWIVAQISDAFNIGPGQNGGTTVTGAVLGSPRH